MLQGCCQYLQYIKIHYKSLPRKKVTFNLCLAVLVEYLEPALAIQQKIGDKAGEAVTNSNIGRAYEGQRDLVKAEDYYSRAVQLAEKIDHPKRKDWRVDLKSVRDEIKGW